MDDKPPASPAKPAPQRHASRLAREADALRANLRKRKDQARQREQAPDSGDPPMQEPPAGSQAPDA